MAVQAIPDGYHSVTPYLIVDGAEKLLAFLGEAFEAKERMRMPNADGGVAHAEAEIGGSVVMVADPAPDFPPSTALIHLYVDDVDATYERALGAGARSVRVPEDQFYGDRSATVRDQFGNGWSIATHIEDVSEDEMMRRMEAGG